MGPFGGSAAVIQVDARHRGAVVAATTNALFFRSRDEGETWRPVAFVAQLRSTLHAFAVSGSGTYFAGVSSDSPGIAGLYRSNDEGATWRHVDGLGSKEVWSIAIWSGGESTMAVGTRDGVYKTTDGGASWRHISPEGNEELAPVVSLAIDPTDSNAIYAGTPHLPWKTADGGATWRSVHEGMLDDSDVFSIHVDASHPSRVFASACSGIYRSENGGGLWAKMKGAKDASYRTYIITQDPSNPQLVYAGTTYGLAKSTDAGTTWRRISPDATRWIAFDPAKPGRMYFATDGAGLFRSDDGGETVHAINNGFCNRQLMTLAWTGSSAVTTSIYEPDHGGVFELKSTGAQWERIAPASGIPAHILGLEAVAGGSSENLFASSYDSLLVSSDGGKNWKPAAGPKGVKVSVFMGTPRGLFAATDAGLFRTEGLGAKAWIRVDGPFGSKKIRVLSALGQSGPGESAMALATASGIYVSKDGVKWKSTAPLPNDGSVNMLCAAGDNTLLAGTTAGLIRSDDFGASWEPVFWDLGGSSISAMRQHPQQPGTVFVAQFGVVYRSLDGGASWTRISSARNSVHLDGEPELETIKGLVVLPGAPGRLLALTKSQGTFELPLPSDQSAAHQTSSIPERNQKTTAQ